MFEHLEPRFKERGYKITITLDPKKWNLYQSWKMSFRSVIDRIGWVDDWFLVKEPMRNHYAHFHGIIIFPFKPTEEMKKQIRTTMWNELGRFEMVKNQTNIQNQWLVLMKLKPESTNRTHETWFDYITKEVAINMERSPNIVWWEAKSNVRRLADSDSESDPELIED